MLKSKDEAEFAKWADHYSGAFSFLDSQPLK